MDFYSCFMYQRFPYEQTEFTRRTSWLWNVLIGLNALFCVLYRSHVYFFRIFDRVGIYVPAVNQSVISSRLVISTAELRVTTVGRNQRSQSHILMQKNVLRHALPHYLHLSIERITLRYYSGKDVQYMVRASIERGF